jgi:release factor glutamine methyltransferase
VLQLPRMQLYLNFDRILTAAELESLRTLIVRRGERQPLQHLVGSTGFCGLDFTVTRDVLIPRPETELLAEEATAFLRARPVSTPPSVLDFGTGSGCVAITVAVGASGADIHALDISEAALAVARANAERHGVLARIVFHHGDGLGALPKDLLFDLILSNPPYIPTGELAGLQPEVRDHDPRTALDGGEDGLRFYRQLAGEGAARLRPAGALIVELGYGQTGSVAGVLTGQGWRVEIVKKDLSGLDRILLARRLD